MITFVQNVATHIGIPFVGMKWLKIAVRGIAKYVGSAEIGGNGTVKTAIGAPMGSAFLAKVVAGESINLLMIEEKLCRSHFLRDNLR